jgi:ABC-type glycerol-3-phosphate transport system permease component
MTGYATGRRLFLGILKYVFLGFILIITLLPLVYTLSASFKTSQEILLGGTNLIPHKLTFANYQQAWKLGNFGRYTLNSLYISILSVLGVAIFSTMTAYVFQRGRFPGRKLVMGVFLSMMFMSAGSVTLYPLIRTAVILKINNINGIIIVNIFGLSVMNLFIAMGYMRTIPLELDEAAVIDGCSFFRIYWNIIFPLVTPMVATVCLLTFRTSWNDYLMPLVFTMGKKATYPLVVGVVALKNTGGEGASQWNLMMAGTMFSILPIVTTYLIMNRNFISGLTSGAVKG